MITLNLNNVENLVFLNKRLRPKLSSHQNLFAQWHLAVITHLPSIKSKTLIDLLNNLTKDDIKIISDYYNEEIVVDQSVACRTIRLIDATTETIEDQLNQINPKGNVTVHRDRTHVYVCLWQ